MKKIGLLCLAVVLALGTVGMGFAYWSEPLEIGQNPVSTGNVDVRFYGASSDDGPGRYDIKEYQYGSAIRWDDKDVGETTIQVVDPHLARLTLSNVYPGYQSRIELGMQNYGSIPAEIESVTINNIVDDNGLLDYVKVGGWIQVQCGPSSYHSKSLASGYPPQSGGPLAGFDVVLFNALKSTQSEPLQTGWKVFLACEDPEEGDSLGFYILPGAPEDATLTLDLEVVWTQFNATP